MLDPVGLGQSFAGFMRLADHDERLVDSKIWTEARHIEQRLAGLTEHMETVIQKYLRNEFATIDAYNEKAGEIAEPYRFLVVADFPTGFTEESARRLASIIESGPRCGVFVLLHHDPRAKLPENITKDTLDAGCSVVEFDKDGSPDYPFVWRRRVRLAPPDPRRTALGHPESRDHRCRRQGRARIGQGRGPVFQPRPIERR